VILTLRVSGNLKLWPSAPQPLGLVPEGCQPDEIGHEAVETAVADQLFKGTTEGLKVSLIFGISLTHVLPWFENELIRYDNTILQYSII
jgi:hypothetical protein